MKTLVSYEGKVLKLKPAPEFSYVSLRELPNGNLIQTNAITEKLIESGISEGDEFQVIIQEDLDGKLHATMTKKDFDDIGSEI
jgi:hypothetical protein